MIFLKEFISVFSFFEYNLQKRNDLTMGEYFYFDDGEDDTIRYIEEQRRKIQKEKEYLDNSLEGD